MSATGAGAMIHALDVRNNMALSVHDAAAVRFTAERERRAELRTHIGEAGRCPSCGAVCHHWSRCRPCRLKAYIARGAIAHAVIGTVRGVQP